MVATCGRFPGRGRLPGAIRYLASQYIFSAVWESSALLMLQGIKDSMGVLSSPCSCLVVSYCMKGCSNISVKIGMSVKMM